MNTHTRARTSTKTKQEQHDDQVTNITHGTRSTNTGQCVEWRCYNRSYWIHTNTPHAKYNELNKLVLPLDWIWQNHCYNCMMKSIHWDECIYMEQFTNSELSHEFYLVLFAVKLWVVSRPLHPLPMWLSGCCWTARSEHSIVTVEIFFVKHHFSST